MTTPVLIMASSAEMIEALDAYCVRDFSKWAAEDQVLLRRCCGRNRLWTDILRLDRIDLKILADLQADGRITNQALADNVALSPSACLARTPPRG